MIKYIKLIVIIFSFSIGLNSCTKNKYVVYQPHYLSVNNDNKHYGDYELDSIEFANTIQVLEYYGEVYKTKNGNVILITKKLSKDWDLLWNYTTKANDEEWLSIHKVK